MSAYLQALWSLGMSVWLGVCVCPSLPYVCVCVLGGESLTPGKWWELTSTRVTSFSNSPLTPSNFPFILLPLSHPADFPELRAKCVLTVKCGE